MNATLVVNAGSSSLKVRWLPDGRFATVERIGRDAVLKVDGTVMEEASIGRHEEALRRALRHVAPGDALAEVSVVGHRVVHGGEEFTDAVVIDDDVEAVIHELSSLAPLHNPANLEGIRAARRILPDVPHVAVFDTAFHASLPPRAYLFGLPYELYAEEGVRRYGFHGPSHDYVTRRAAELLGRPRDDLDIVSLHLGNGASAAAVSRGRAVDTSMGLTPLDGLLMGTRCGDLDPGVVLHLLRGGRSLDEVDQMLNQRSGLRGVSGVSNDMRDVRGAAVAGNDRARKALDLFGYRVRKTIGAFAAAMGHLDAVVFTGGIGENDPQTREESLHGLEVLGIALDRAANRAGAEAVHAADSRVAVLVVPTDEETMIARHAQDAVA